MKRKPPAITPEDAALFRGSIGDVRALAPPAPPPQRPRPAPEAKMQVRDEALALQQSQTTAYLEATIDGAEALAYRRSEVPEAVLKSLKR
ncbi:MAG: SMR domain protein, partial [Arenimonas sp.]|nr:SMR domain protein [Arenimonas sp.]